MRQVIIIGDGPGGLSAALFLAKNKIDVVVYGLDETAMKVALLKNYLGVPEMRGTEFQALALKQVASFGAEVRRECAIRLSGVEGQWTIGLDSGVSVEGRYLILCEGKVPRLAQQIGLVFDPASGIATDKNARTALGVYVVGRSARPGRSQAIISAGDGAAAAIDILSREKKANFTDWDAAQ